MALDIRPTGHMKILNKVARLYDLVLEMREVVAELHEMHVEVHIGRWNHDHSEDPVASFAAMQITLRPGCELIP